LTSAPAKVVALLCGALIALWLPFLMSSYGLRLLDLSLISAIAVLGLCFAFGYAGLLHLGQAAFVGIGAYTSALAATRMGLEFWFSMPIAIALTMIVGIGIGVPMLRLRGHYLALATVGFNVTVDIVARNWTDVTGGENGLSSIPSIGISGFRFDSDQRFYYLGLAVLVIACLVAFAIRHSRFGRAVLRAKVLAFALAAAFAGLSGALYAHYTRYIAPNDFDLVRSITLLVMLIVGGESSILGAVGGAVLISFAPELLRFVGEAYLAVFGIGVLILLIVMPDGIAGALLRLRRFAVIHHD
jgi:branched-chain amino acid transport system permease protein